MQDPSRVAPHPTLRSFYEDDAERQRYINDLFDRGSRDYDWVNNVLSFGSGYWYRGEVLRRAGVREGMSVLDVATGTGPVAAAAKQIVGASGRVVAADPSAGMLGVARKKVDGRFAQAVGEALPFRNDVFDVLTMGYALRHVSDLRAAFADYRRVLKPGGRLVIMEISMPSSRAGRALLRAYMGILAPLVARLGTRRRDTERMMRYYWATTESCVAADVVLETMRGAGLLDVRRVVRYGIMAEYHGVK